MAETELPWIFTEPLEREGLAYMIVGAFATLAFGVNRTTEDLDMVFGLVVSDAARFARAFPDAEFYRPPTETFITEVARASHGHFNLVHHASLYRADCYMVGNDALQHWGLKHRRRIELEGRGCWVAPPEVVILKKLEFFREGGSQKHVRDIQAVLKLLEVDRDFIEAQVARLGLREQWLVCQRDG